MNTRKEFDRGYLESLGFTKLKSVAKAVAKERGIEGIMKGGKAAVVERLVAMGEAESAAASSARAARQLGLEGRETTSEWGQVLFDMDNDGDPDLVVLNGGYEGPYQLGTFRPYIYMRWKRPPNQVRCCCGGGGRAVRESERGRGDGGGAVLSGHHRDGGAGRRSVPPVLVSPNASFDAG